MDHSKEKIEPGLALRPRFAIESKLSPEEVSVALKAALSEQSCPVKGSAIPGHAVLRLPRKDQKPWSPQLALEILEGKEKNGSVIKGVYGPAPGIWTLFMFLYVTIGFSIFVLLFWGLALFSLGEPAALLWFAIPLSVLLIALWFSAQTGQRLSRHQIEILHDFLKETLEMSEASK